MSIKGVHVAKMILRALSLLLALQFLAGFTTISFSNNERLFELNSLFIVILLLIFKWYIWLIPYCLLVFFINKIYSQQRYPTYCYRCTYILVYIIYFGLVYRGSFWQLHCIYDKCTFTEWFDSEKRDLFFNLFALISLIYYISIISRSIKAREAVANKKTT